MYKKAMLCILAELKRTKRLKVIEPLKIKAPKTKEFLNLFKGEDLSKTLLIVEEVTENLIRSTSNLFYINVHTAKTVDPIALCNSHQVLIEKKAYEQLIERFTNA